MKATKILLVGEDEKAILQFENIVKKDGYEFHKASNEKEVEALLLNVQFNLIYINLHFWSVKLYYICYKIRSNESLRHIPVMVQSHVFNAEHQPILKKLGIDLVIGKVIEHDVLTRSVSSLITSPPERAKFDSDSFLALFFKLNYEIIKDLEKENLRPELPSINDKLSRANAKTKHESDVTIAQQEDTLRKSEQHLKIIFSNTQEEILVLDSEGKIIFFNESLAKFISIATGVKPELGMALWDMAIETRKQDSKDLFTRALKGEQIEVEATVEIKGERFIHLLRYSPVYIDDKIIYVTIISRDVTKKRKQESELKKSEANLKAIFKNTVDGFALLDEDLNFISFNDNFKNYTKEQSAMDVLEGQSILSVIHENQRSSFKEQINRVHKGEVIRSITKYGEGISQKWFDVSINPVSESGNIINGYCITSHDSTESKNREFEITRLNKSLQDFQNAIQQSSIVSVADSDGNITFVNDNFVKISGYSRDELQGRNHRIVNSGYHPKSFWVNMWKTISSGKIWRNRVKNKRKDGSFYWVDTFVMPFMDEGGKIKEFLSIRNDITLSKHTEEELIQKQILLQEASRISRIGYYVIDKKTGAISASPELLWIFDVTEAEFAADPGILRKQIHPDDEARIPSKSSYDEHDPTVIEFRVIHKDGSIHWLYRKSKFSMVIDNEDKVIGTIQDITERKANEVAMREHIERFELLSRATNDAIWDVNLRSNKIIWNHAISHIFGYDIKAMNSTVEWWQQKLHPDDRERVTSELETLTANKISAWNCTFRFECADGSFKDVYNRSYIMYDNGNPTRLIGSLQDISDRVRAVEEIKKLSLVASQTNNGVMITDKDGLIEWVNESFTKLTGYSNDEIKGKTPDFLHGEDTDKATLQRIAEKTSRNEPVSEEILYHTKNLDRIWLRLDIVPTFDEAGAVKTFISTQTDITELKEFENSITSIARELANLIENANVPIFSVDPNGKVNEWNNVSAELTGYSKEEVMGTKWDELFVAQGNLRKTETILKEALNGISISNVELPVVTKKDTHLILLVSASPRRNTQNEITGVIFVGQNITELTDYRNNLERKVEERTRELHVALDKEKELVKLKSQFVSIASHEFRTPLTSISLAAGTIRKYKEKLTSQSIDEKIANIEKQVHHMTYLLDDILLVGKAEAGKIQVNLKPVMVSDFLRHLCAEVVKTTGETHQINYTESLKHLEIMSDEKLLRNIVINVLTNAIKFSPGETHVAVSLVTENEMLYLKVKDSGIGIPEKDFSNLSQPFFRGGNVHAIQGTGLGLSIVKKAIELLDGTFDYTSKVDVGTEISITLPI